MSPDSSAPSPSGNEHMRPEYPQLARKQKEKPMLGRAYHIPPQISFFVLLEAFEILKNTRTGIFDVLLGHV
jgi:hypothetical protein